APHPLDSLRRRRRMQRTAARTRRRTNRTRSRRSGLSTAKIRSRINKRSLRRHGVFPAVTPSGYARSESRAIARATGRTPRRNGDPLALKGDLWRSSFALVVEGEPAVTSRFYEVLFRKYPQAEPLFGRRSRAEQERMLRDMLVAIVDHLEDAAWL